MISVEQESIESLNEIKRNPGFLVDDNGLAVSPQIINTAIRTLHKVLDVSHAPEITANYNGTVSLEWESPHGIAHLELGKTKYSMYVSSSNEENVFYNGWIIELADNIDEMLSTLNCLLYKTEF